MKTEVLPVITARQIRNACVFGILLGSVVMIALCIIIDRFQINFTF